MNLFLTSLIIFMVSADASPLRALKRKPRKFSLSDASGVLHKMLGSSKGGQDKVDPSKINIPPYMLDLFKLVADQDGNKRPDVSLDGSIVRSFFNEGIKF